METKEKINKIKELIKKRDAEISNKQVEALAKKIDELVLAIKAKPETHIVTQVPPTIHVDNLKEIEKAPDIITVKNIDRKVTGSVAVDNFPQKMEVEMKKPGWVKEIQKVEITNKAEKPGWLDSVIADVMGLFAALFAKVAAGTVEGIAKVLTGLWAAGITVKIKGMQQVVVIDPKTGKPMGKYDFGGGGGGMMIGPSQGSRSERPKIETLTLTNAGDVYSYAVPDVALRMDFRLRDSSYDLLYSYDNFTNYFTLPAGSVKTLADIKFTGMTLYFKCAQAAQVVEIETLRN
jgi:hypothetical protein